MDRLWSFESRPSLASKSLSDLIRAYQSYHNSPLVHSNYFSSDFLSLISTYQQSLRRLSLFHTTVRAIDSGLFPLILSGNLMPNPSLPRFPLAFPDLNVFTSLPNFLNFLRQHPTFFSFLICSAIETHPRESQLLSFSAIPAIFQNGWCDEESLLWTQFLEKYMQHCREAIGA
jgi:hypothetical protein